MGLNPQCNGDQVHNENTTEKVSRALVIPNQFDEDLQALNEMVKSMMEKSKNLMLAREQMGHPAKRKLSVAKCAEKRDQFKQ